MIGPYKGKIYAPYHQNGSEEKGWRGTPNSWSAIHAHQNAPYAMYSAGLLN